MSEPSFGGDGYQTELEVRRWAAAVEAKAARYQIMQAQVGEITATESSPDGVVEVTVGASGLVTDLRISDRSRELPGARLAALVLDTMRRAQSRITDKVAEVAQQTIGDDPATVASMVESYRQRFPEPEPEIAPHRPDDELRLGDPMAEEPPPPPPPAWPTREPRRRRGDDDNDDGPSTVFD
ncbi:YbaB/EbfC family nucleoid-associated protein [Actinophytocola sp.]|uniref:YbaB/EbfC family nucleoid-associated protein n=1 Tax=Actinophytocola sp. TaxID=1872138 RepID=UPI002D7E89A2|nr:YbaB/EbfC family nucleoid-associated protein [Actinophytocola sp.]HET9137785.1 YbaB/EbfC family nucleoid-associated protein [Actinophytocola sp.]HEU5108900.1 YbaB/EbfC family nucleoid-associated protein [Micromonosporaceae bacterium]